MIIVLDEFKLFLIGFFTLIVLLGLRSRWFNIGYNIGFQAGKQSGADERESLAESLAEAGSTVDSLKSKVAELKGQLSDKDKELEQANASKQVEVAKAVETGRTELTDLTNAKARLEAIVVDLRAKVAALERKKEEPATELPEHEQTTAKQAKTTLSKRTARDEILGALEARDLTFKEIVDKTGRAKSTISEALERLVREGKVSKDPNTGAFHAVRPLKHIEPNSQTELPNTELKSTDGRTN